MLEWLPHQHLTSLACQVLLQLLLSIHNAVSKSLKETLLVCESTLSYAGGLGAVCAGRGCDGFLHLADVQAGEANFPR